MLTKITLVVSLLNICAGNVPKHPSPQSNLAVSSQSFVRHDVPLSYKFSSVHVYSTPKTDSYKHKHYVQQQVLARPNPGKEIQYAPIFNGQVFKAPNQNGPVEISDGANVIAIAKTHLEPKPNNLQGSKHQQEHLAYVPGYNVEVLQAVNRYPGHNAVYRSYPNMSPHEKINKVNYLNQYVPFQKTGDEIETTVHNVDISAVTETSVQTKPTITTLAPKQHLHVEQRPNLYNTAHIAAIKALPPAQASFINIQEFIPHPKTHRMLLNIARAYNIAHESQKAPGSSLTMLRSVPALTSSIIRIPNPASVEKDTKLLPIQNKKIRHPVRFA